MMSRDEPIERHEFDAASLMREHPPVLWDANKKAVFDVACPEGCEHRGRISVSHWAAMPLPETCEPARAAGILEVTEGIYDYRPAGDVPGLWEWHVNFADPELFVAYGSPLFAQDELQVAEHPILGAVREALLAAGGGARTVEHGRPTPVVLTGVERRCQVDVAPHAAAGRPQGLYGNAFARASREVVRRATTRIEPPTTTNLIAMGAPAGGHGRYSRQEIAYILTTAFTGFRAAVLESARAAGRPVPVCVHSGFWGCGAFGGNRVLMVSLQALAAAMAHLERLVIHAANAPRSDVLDTVIPLLAAESGRTVVTGDLIGRLEARGFAWGVSDGN